jgi:hypothetical protein
MSEFTITAENQDKYTLDELKFIYELSEKKLKETDNSNSIVSRTTTLLGIVSTILVALIIYLGSNLSVNFFQNKNSLIALFALIYFLSFGFLLTFNIRGIKYQVVGEEPQIFMRNDFFSAADDNTRKKWLYITELNRQQQKIKFNKGINNLCWQRYRFSIYGLLLTPIILGIAFFIVSKLL